MSAEGAGSQSSTGYAPSPRPTFNGAAFIPAGEAVHHVWGDEASGEVLDRIFVSSSKIHQLVFSLPDGSGFTHSSSFRTVFAADEVLYILTGVIVLANPATGEVQRLEAGEAALFGPDTWHHAFSWGGSTASVLEYLAPPPAAGTAGTYARAQPLLTDVTYADEAQLGRWPPGSSSQPTSFRVIGRKERLWRLEGDSDPVLVGILASTPHLTVASCELRPHQRSDWRVHSGDCAGYVSSGQVIVRLGGATGRLWRELGAGDGFYVPEGDRYQLWNPAQTPAAVLLGVAPAYAFPPGTAP